MFSALKLAEASPDTPYEKNFEMNHLSLNHLATFRLVIRRGSFSAAADALCLSQPAVSLQVKQLEQFFGTKLVERTGRGLSPTSAGLALLAHEERITQAVEDARSAVNEISQTVTGTIRIGTGATACIHLLPPLLQKLRRDWPLLQVGVTTGNTLEIVRAVEENRLDLGLVTLPIGQSPLIVNYAMDEEFVFIISESEETTLATPDALSASSFIAFEAGSGTRALIDNWFSGRGLTITPAMESGSIEAIKRLVRSGAGVSIIPRMAVTTPDDRKGLKVCSLQPALYRQLALVMRADKILSKGLTEVLRLFK